MYPKYVGVSIIHSRAVTHMMYLTYRAWLLLLHSGGNRRTIRLYRGWLKYAINAAMDGLI